jgi:hypothetical protein
MHDINPLGPVMHLKDFDRQATLNRPLRPGRHDAFSFAAFRGAIFALLQRLLTIGEQQQVKHGARPSSVLSKSRHLLEIPDVSRLRRGYD